MRASWKHVLYIVVFRSAERIFQIASIFNSLIVVKSWHVSPRWPRVWVINLWHAGWCWPSIPKLFRRSCSWRSSVANVFCWLVIRVVSAGAYDFQIFFALLWYTRVNYADMCVVFSFSACVGGKKWLPGGAWWSVMLSWHGKLFQKGCSGFTCLQPCREARVSDPNCFFLCYCLSTCECKALSEFRILLPITFVGNCRWSAAWRSFLWGEIIYSITLASLLSLFCASFFSVCVMVRLVVD